MKYEKEEAFRLLLKEYGKIIYKVCYLYATDEDNFKDLRQEILINLWNGFVEFRGEAKVSSWIYRISLNTCISYYRRYGKTKSELSLDTVINLTSKEREIQKNYVKCISLSTSLIVWKKPLFYCDSTNDHMKKLLK